MIICGAGPAGSTCALALADSGLKVAVIEQHRFPRDKICGDAVAAYVPDVLSTIHPRFRNALNAFTDRQPVNICRLVAPNLKHIDITYSKSGFISKRLVWDNFLFDLASQQNNISFFLDHHVSDVSVDQSRQGVTVHANDTMFRARIVIGCDGAHSVVKKKMTDTRLNLSHHAGAVRAYYRGVTGICPSTFELHFMKGLLPGYFWIFPLNDNMANVGLGLLSAKVSERRYPLRESLDNMIRSVPYIATRFEKAELVGKIEGFGLPLGSRKVPLSGERFMLCGDAGSLIDPLSGEGIGQAMVSGRYAGWHAKKCFEENDFSSSFMRQYDAQVYRKFWKRHRKNHWIQRMIADRDWLFNGIFNAGVRSRFLRNLLIENLA